MLAAAEFAQDSQRYSGGRAFSCDEFGSGSAL